MYVFHVVAPATQVWQKVISKPNASNIFPASVPQNPVVKILQSNCISQSKKYVPVSYLWLNRVFTDLANSHEKHCLTIDCSYKNKIEPGWYRSAADNPDEQVCYFNKPNDDKYYNVFISKQIKVDNFSEGIYFKIERVKGKTEKENFDIKKTLEDGTQAMIDFQKFSQFQGQSRLEQKEKKDMETLLSTFKEEIGSQHFS